MTTEARIQRLPGPVKVGAQVQPIKTSATTWACRFRTPGERNSWTYVTDQRGRMARFGSYDDAVAGGTAAREAAVRDRAAGP